MLRNDIRRHFERGREPIPDSYSKNGTCVLPGDIKESIARGIDNELFKSADIQRIYGIEKSIISKALSRYRNGLSLQTGSGRPKDFNPRVSQMLVDQIIGRDSYQERKSIFEKEALDTINEDRAEHGLAPKEHISKSTMLRLYRTMAKKHGIKSNNADCGTAAREKAVSSRLNALSLAAALNVFVPNFKCRDQATNSDATTFEASGSIKNIEVISGPVPQNGQIKVEADPECPDENNLKFSIKKYVTCIIALHFFLARRL